MLKRRQLRDRLSTLYWSGVGMLSAGIVSLQRVYADNIFERIQSIVYDIYGQIVAISTIVAVTVASIALIVRMISRNQRAVDEATSWLKRIVVAWIVLNSLGFVVAYLQPLVAGGQYVGG
ncbi:MAG: fimbrial protein [Oscillospiraceae bacterium]|nr:fimbrial protein [Oscillospiraceae bacterium]